MYATATKYEFDSVKVPVTTTHKCDTGKTYKDKGEMDLKSQLFSNVDFKEEIRKYKSESKCRQRESQTCLDLIGRQINTRSFFGNQLIEEVKRCIPDGKVSCGRHRADSCERCPLDGTIDRGKKWCNGDCFWRGNKCAVKGIFCGHSLKGHLKSKLSTNRNLNSDLLYNFAV